MSITLHTLQKMHAAGEKIAVLTCYDASFASLLENVGVEILLVGDSLGMTLQGESTTLGVTLEQMAYHTRCVNRGAKKAFIIADLPFGSYQESPQQAYRSAAMLMAAGAHMVKLEGGRNMAETVAFLTGRGIPVCGHIGLQPQSVHQLGGYRVQGRDETGADSLNQDALALQQAGASLLVLEAVPASLAQHISQELTIPTIGIGAGVDCSGQVLVLHDAIGIYGGKTPRFARNFMEGSHSVQEAVSAFVLAVKEGSFPAQEHGF